MNAPSVQLDSDGRPTRPLDVTEVDGLAASCVTQVHADLYTGLWIETTWSSPGDVDLHLFHPEAGDPREPSTWFTLPYDCHHSNRTPRWDGLSRVDDPRLEHDDEVGSGPESIVIDEPSTGHLYEVGVHWFGGEAESEQVTTRIHCGGAVAGTITTTLAELHQAAWVATVQRLADGSCTVEARGDVITVDP